LVKFSDAQSARWKREAMAEHPKIPAGTSYGMRMKYHLQNEFEKEMNKGRSFTNYWDVSDITLVMPNS
jgi:hypothetical protein